MKTNKQTRTGQNKQTEGEKAPPPPKKSPKNADAETHNLHT